jgi:DNA-binding transcriptional LysR family regulator
MTQARINISGDVIGIEGLTLTDGALAAFVRETPGAEREQLVERALRIGLLTLSNAGVSMSADVVKAEFERLYERIAPMILELDAAVAEAVASTGRTAGTLRINTPGMAARKVISTRLGRFHRAHPGVVLDIVVDDSLSDIVAGRFDAGIRVGKRLEKDMTVIRVTPDVKMIVAASPDYLARCGEPTSPVDLRRHACINWRLPGRDGIARWEFEKKGKKIEIAVQGPLIANRQDVGVAAALQGLGILYAYDDDGVGEAIQQGRLERILTDWSPVRPGLYLYYSNRRHPSPVLRAFIDCLLDKDESSPRVK